MMQSGTTEVTVEHGGGYAEYLPLVNTFFLAAFFIIACYGAFRGLRAAASWVVGTAFPEFKQTIRDATVTNASAAATVKESVDKHIDFGNTMLAEMKEQHTDILNILKGQRK